MKSEQPDLKPCPFCGGKPSLVDYGHKRHKWVSCDRASCRVNPRTDLFERRRYAIGAWNKRANR